jgi:ribulose-phosphate 3-epimerase
MHVMAGPLLDISLWSADLANLERDIRKLEPHAYSFHFDAADGHFVPSLLFFPDLIARLRELTQVPFHLHLMATRPLDLIDAFLDAGVNRVTLPVEAGKRVRQALDRTKERGASCGVSLDVETPVMQVKDYLPVIDTILMMGTPMGVKGKALDERACVRIESMRRTIGRQNVRIFADGGIRRETVPLLWAAGADGIVPGSLVCSSPDLDETVRWLNTLSE